MGDPREEELGRRVAAARQRAGREKVEKLEQALKEMTKVQAAPKARAEKSKHRARETDPEARIMKQSDGGHAPSHNVQVSTDVAHGIILGVSVTQEAHDHGQLVPALEEVQRQMGRFPKQMVVDAGYTSRENILAAAERGVDLMGGTLEQDAEAAAWALARQRFDPASYPQSFRYNAATNTYTYPAGKELPYLTTNYDRVGVERHIYRARLAHCRACAFRERCTSAIRSRPIVRSENVPEVAAYVAKMRTEAVQALYRVRAPVAEFTNAWLKAKLGL